MSRSSSTFLGSLEPRLRDELNLLGRNRWYDPGDTIYQQGQLATSVMAVTQGRVSLESTVDGATPFVGIRYSGHLLGDSETLSGRPVLRRQTARALDEVSILIVPSIDFWRLTAENPWMWASIAKDTRARLDTAEFWIGQLAGANSERRLARILLYFADQEMLKYGAAGVDLSYKQLASWIGVTSRTVERHLSEWEELGYITRPQTRGPLLIRNPGKLAERANFEATTPPQDRPSSRLISHLSA